MAIVNYFKNAQGRIVLDATSAEFFYTDITKGLTSQSEVYIEFFSDVDGNTPVTPTGGTVTIEASPMGNSYLEASNDSVVDATEVGADTSTYTPPQLDGLIERGRLKFEGITGALTARVILYRH